MKTLKEKRLFVTISAVIFLVLLCFTFSTRILIPKLCKDEGQDILQNHFQIDYSTISLFGLLKEELFWEICEEEQEVLFLEACQEQDRNLPPNTEILVSACTGPYAVEVPGGEVVFVHEGLTNKMYLLDLRTGEKRDVPDDPRFEHAIFLSSELVWLEGSFNRAENPGFSPHYILDLTDGQRYELRELDGLPRLDNYQFDPQYYTVFQSAEKVFLHHSKNVLIALAPDFQHHPEGNVIISQYILAPTSAENGEVFEKLMKDLGKDYEIIDLSTTQYADLPSPTGRYVVRHDGIYLSGTNTPFVTSQYMEVRFLGEYFKGWYYDESGIVVQGGGVNLIYSPIGSNVRFYVFSPVLKLRLPTP